MEWHNRLQHEGLLDLIKNGLPCPTEASGWAHPERTDRYQPRNLIIDPLQ